MSDLSIKMINTAQKMKFFIKDFFSKCDQIRRKLDADLVTFTEEILNGKPHFLSSESSAVSRSAAYPLKIIFEASLGGEFPECWKRASVVLVHKKGSKNLVKNYKPISLLLIFGKIFEKVIFMYLFNYFHKNELFSKHQSGFLPSDSSVSQILSIVHDINSSFDCDPTQDVSGVFLDISEAFNNVWHEGLLYKFQIYGVKGEVLNLLRNYLHKRYQRVVLNGQTLDSDN